MNRLGSIHKKAVTVAGILLVGLFPTLSAAQEKLVSERGSIAIQATSPVDHFRVERDRDPIPRNFEQQPPLIPHTVKGYNITQNFNQCMDCHSEARAKETRATKVGKSHYETREGSKLPNISPRRYFCMQCHVPQFDAKPLVENTFRPAPAKKAQ
jgi:nitrate reductase (cytochrome), electron transfer subunit